MAYNTSRIGAGTYVGFAVIGVVALFWYLWGAQSAHGFYVFFSGGAYILIPIVVVFILTVAAVIFTGIGRVIAIFAALFITGLTIFGWVHYNYDIARQYVGQVKVVDHAAPDYDERAPFDVASASSTRNLGDTTGSALNVKILADQGDHGLWTALVERRGFIAGYESVQVQNTPLYGTTEAAQVTTCKFDFVKAGLKLGGTWPADSLDRQIFANTPPSVYFDEGDAYAYCDGKTAKVVVPLKSLDGFWSPTWTAYGAAVYNGSTGGLSVTTDTSKIPGPVYPQSLARAQRESLHALGSFDDAWWGRSGYKETSDDVDDPNGANPSELSLRDADTGDAAYVSPLTPQGSSKSVTALSVVDATTATHGGRNTLTVYKYEQKDARQANSSIAQAIQTQFSWMPDWASGLKIFELVPGRGGAWVASIGKNQSVVYRAVVQADGKAVLYDENGDEVTRTGAVSNGDTGSTDTTVPAADGDLKKMTSQQLTQLGQAILNELASRSTATPTAKPMLAPTATPSPKK